MINRELKAASAKLMVLKSPLTKGFMGVDRT